MTEEVPAHDPLRADSRLRTPHAMAAAGIIFSVLAIAALVLLKVSVPAHAAAPGAWLTNSRRRGTVAIALNLIPFAGIAFLWFVGVLRDQFGGRESRFFATVFLGSGLLYVGMMLAGAAVAGGLIASQASSGPLAGGVLAVGRHITFLLVNVYATRMAAVFTFSTVTIARATKIVARWLTIAGLASGLVLLVLAGTVPWLELLFPAWVLAVSIDIIVRRSRASAGRNPARPA